MQMTKCVVALIFLLGICTPCSAQESTAYMLRYEDGPLTELVKVDIPSEYLPEYPVEPTVVGLLGMGWVSSMAMSPLGQLLALDFDGDRLLEINIENGAASPFVDLDLDIEWDSGIAFDDSGQGWLLNTGSQSSLYHLNHQTGETSLVIQLDDTVYGIGVHNGAVFAGRGSEFVEVDTMTGELTVLMDLQGFEWACFLKALHSNVSDLWGIWLCRSGVGGGQPGPRSASLVSFFPLESIVDIVYDDHDYMDGPFALVVVTQPPPAAIPALTPPGLIVLALLLAGAGFLIVRSRFSG